VYGVLIGAQDWLRQHPDLVVRFLKPLIYLDGLGAVKPEAVNIIR